MPQRPRRTKAQWKQLIDDKHQSVLSVEEYCKQHNVAASNFYTWRSKLAKENQCPPAADNLNPDWLPIELPATTRSSSWDIELDLPGGVCLRVKSA